MSRAQQYPRLILALVCLPVFIGALDLTIVSAVLPEVIRSMTIEIQKLDVAGWVVTGYFVSYAISMTFMGRVSDIAGRRIVYLVCLAIFFVGSWLVAASPGWPAAVVQRVMQPFSADSPSDLAPLYALIVGRVIQAFGAGAMVPVSMAGFSARDRRSGRHRRLGSGSSVRRHHGAVHELALPFLDKSPGRLCDLLRDVAGVGRPAAHGREGRHRLDRRGACWRGTNSAQYWTWLAGNQPRRIDRPSAAASPVLDCSGRCH